MLRALISGDIKLFEKMLRKVVLAVFSYHDFGEEPGKVYYALVAGLLVWIANTHDKDLGTVTHDNELSPGDDEIKKNSVSSVTSVAKSNFMAAPHEAAATPGDI